MRLLLAGGSLGLGMDEQRNRQPSPERILADELPAFGVTVTAIGLKDYGSVLRGEYDIIHVHHMSKAAVLASRLRKPFLFTHHSAVYGESGVRAIAEWLVWKGADRIVCLSDTERAEKSSRLGLPEVRLPVIPNGTVPLSTTPLSRRYVRGEPFVVAYVGQLIELKRVELAIEALTRLPEWVMLELTYHNSSLESRLMTLVEQLGLSKRVRFLRQASGAELLERFERASMLVLPSRTEALPSVVTEALMLGLPVVASDVGAIREQVRGGGVVVPRASGDFAPAIQRVLCDYASYATKAAVRGAELRRITPSVMAQRHASLYCEVLGSFA